MTVGETIQKYRKSLGMSQEELGQKLLVSRQTISLWEKDQTVPTIDNLLRLREVFHVSVDEILGIERQESVSEMGALETYQFHYTRTDSDEIYRLQRKTIHKKPLLFSMVCVYLLAVLFGSSAPKFLIGYVFGMFAIGLVSYIKGIRSYHKAWQKSAERFCESTYEYKVFEEYIVVNIYRKNEKVRESKCYYKDIERTQQLGRWVLFQFGGQTFVIRKSDLKENSALFPHLCQKPPKPTGSAVPTKWSIASFLLFAASLASIFSAMALVAIVSNVNNLSVENMWLFILPTPIPIASIVLGYVLKSKGYPYLKNIIAGIVMTILLCIFGLFSSAFAIAYDYSDEPILRVEQMMEIDIPEYRQINTKDWTKGTQSVSRGYIYSSSDVYFANAVAEKFEKELVTDEKWLSSVPNDLIGITYPLAEYSGYDYILIYNIDTSEFNALPRDSGTFRFINILYTSKGRHMEIVEYSIDYLK